MKTAAVLKIKKKVLSSNSVVFIGRLGFFSSMLKLKIVYNPERGITNNLGSVFAFIRKWLGF